MFQRNILSNIKLIYSNKFRIKILLNCSFCIHYQIIFMTLQYYINILLNPIPIITSKSWHYDKFKYFEYLTNQTYVIYTFFLFTDIYFFFKIIFHKQYFFLFLTLILYYVLFLLFTLKLFPYLIKAVTRYSKTSLFKEMFVLNFVIFF